MFVVVDGLGRSGKFLVGKFLLLSNQVRAQHFTGIAERLLESYYASRNTSESRLFSDLFFNYLRISQQDLAQLRLASLNKTDSSYFKNSEYYRCNSHLIDNGLIPPDLSPHDLYITHTHNSLDYIKYLKSKNLIAFRESVSKVVVVQRDPIVLLASWLKRGYIDIWSNQKTTPTLSVAADFYNEEVKNKLGGKVSRLINRCITKALSLNMFTVEELTQMSLADIFAITIAVATQYYLEQSKEDQHSDIYSYYFHEHLHTAPEAALSRFSSLLGLDFNHESFKMFCHHELNASMFGLESLSNQVDLFLADNGLTPLVADLIIGSHNLYLEHLHALSVDH